MKNSLFCTRLTIVATAALLAACGGGGSSDPALPTPVPVVTPAPIVTPVPVVTPASLQTTVPALTYATSSEEYAFVSAYNDFRGKHGLGLLAQNPALDTAAKNHLNYLMLNKDTNWITGILDPASGVPLFHIENPARSGFTGVTELQRMQFAGYPATYGGEFGSYGGGRGGKIAFQSLINTVYHRMGLMSQFPREIGIAAGTDGYQTFVIEYGYQSTQQRNSKDFFGAYPADSQTGIPLSTSLETPNPFPDVTYSELASKTSYPVSVASQEYTSLTVGAFTITEAGQSTALPGRIMTQANDQNNMIWKNVAFFIGGAPFKANTTYNAAFSGTVNGAAINKTWSFSTGN